MTVIQHDLETFYNSTISFLNETHTFGAQLEPKNIIVKVYLVSPWEAFLESFNFTYQNLKIIRYPCHEVWTAKLITWYLELNWSFNVITILKIFSFRKSNVAPIFWLKYIFIILLWKIEGFSPPKLVTATVLDQYIKESKIWTKNIILVFHFSSHLLKMRKKVELK